LARALDGSLDNSVSDDPRYLKADKLCETIGATADDYKSWLDFVLERQAVATLKEVMETRAKFSVAGAGTGSRVQVALIEIAQHGLDAAIDLALGQFNRVSIRANVDRSMLRGITEKCLRSFVVRLQTVLVPTAGAMPGSADILKTRMPELDGRLDKALHWFDRGLLTVTEPQVPISMTNTIHIGSMVNSSVQQGSHDANQAIQIATGDISTALGELEGHLSTLTLAENEKTSIAADVATIKAQLLKPNPSRAILSEAGKSIRSIVENIAASAVTPQVLAALANFVRSIGLS
jgi:hypothetical protein